jgi:heme oxygenase
MILERIKKETQENHLRMESSSLMSKITNKTITLSDYLKILTKFYGFFHPLEIQLDQLSEIENFLPDYPQRRKAYSLSKDIEQLGEKGANCILCNDLPSINNMSEAFGILYVMEGSTLGGRMISKLLEEKLSLSAARGIQFFNGYGPLTGERWNTFRKSMVDFAEATKDEDTIIKSANQTFHKFYNWINL